jgi:hypothetical protein
VKARDVSIQRHASGVECYGTDRDGYYIAKLYIGYTVKEARALFAEYVTMQERRDAWRSGGA